MTEKACGWWQCPLTLLSQYYQLERAILITLAANLLLATYIIIYLFCTLLLILCRGYSRYGLSQWDDTPIHTYIVYFSRSQGCPPLLFLVCLSFRIVVVRDPGFPPLGGISCMLCLGTCFCSWLLLPAFWLLPWILCLLGFLWVCPCILIFFLVPILFCFPSCVLPCFSLLLFLSLPWILLELPFCTPLWILLVSSPSFLLGTLVFVGILCFPWPSCPFPLCWGWFLGCCFVRDWSGCACLVCSYSS